MKRLICPSWLRWSALCGLVAVGVGACGWFDDPTPQTVRLSFRGDAGKQFELVVSQSFGAQGTEDGGTRVTVGVADTLIRTLPFDTVYRLQGGSTLLDPVRFFFQAKRFDEDVSQVSVEAYLDDDIKYQKAGPMVTEIYLWAFTFNQAIGEIEEVL